MQPWQVQTLLPRVFTHFSTHESCFPASWLHAWSLTLKSWLNPPQQTSDQPLINTFPIPWWLILASCSLTDLKSRAGGGISGRQHEPQRGVPPLLHTTHHRAPCTLKVRPMMMFLVYLWQIEVGFLHSLLSGPLHLLLQWEQDFLFFFVCYISRNTPGIRTYVGMHDMHTSCSAAWFSLPMLTVSHFSLSVCLYLLHHTQYSLSPSVSINHSWPAAAD